MDFSSAYKNAAVAGLCFIGMSVFMLSMRPLGKIIAEPSIWTTVLFLTTVVLYVVTFVFHMRGYVALFKNMGDSILLYTTHVLVGALSLFGLSIVLVVVGSPDPEITTYLNGLVGLAVVTLLIPAITFAAAAFLHHGFSLRVFIASSLTPAITLMFWDPWLTGPLVAISTYYFWKNPSRL
jgi:hypothetical protein